MARLAESLCKRVDLAFYAEETPGFCLQGRKSLSILCSKLVEFVLITDKDIVEPSVGT